MSLDCNPVDMLVDRTLRPPGSRGSVFATYLFEMIDLEWAKGEVAKVQNHSCGEEYFGMAPTATWDPMYYLVIDCKEEFLRGKKECEK